ncbi:MAG: dihydropteroate synthase [Planctomycetota bacterium]|jgi:dihydropteroate synthase
MQNHPKTVIEWPAGRLDFSAGCIVMGVLNVTPDSFSDGGNFLKTETAVAHGIEMARAGAAIIDVGAESTRPGSLPVPTAEQIKRAVPVIEALNESLAIPISIDTYNLDVAAAAIKAGASIINDISALGDERMGRLAAEYDLPVVLMHMQATPATMQTQPQYDDVVEEVLQFLLERAQKARQLGVDKSKIFIDPGIGFGKTLEHNILLLKNIDRFVHSGYRVLVGASRKSFIGQLTGKQDPARRIFGTAATVALCVAAGVSVVRVHDVDEMLDVIKVTRAIVQR